MQKKEFVRALKFTIFSISAGIIQIVLFALLNELLELDYWISYISSLLASILWNFTINRKVTFKSSNNVYKSMSLVLLFYLVFTPVSTYLGDLAENNNINEYLILGITMISNFILEYLYTRFIVYKNSCDNIQENKKRSFLYVFLRFFVKIFYRKRKFIGLENVSEEPVIFIGNHAQIHGPLTAEAYFPLKKKTWCIGNVLTTKEFINHAKTDFWGKKPKWNKWFFMGLAYIIAPLGASIFRSSDVIGVYKDARLRKTFKDTINELNKGNNIIIFPEEVEEYNHIVNEFQDKFVDVARSYYRLYGKVLSFVPMYNAVRIKKVLIGKPIKYNPELSIEENRKIIVSYLKEEITRLALSLQPHKVIQYINTGRKNNPMSK